MKPIASRTVRALAAAAALALAAPAAAEDAPPPPWIMTGANTVTVAVIWDAASLEGLLPEGLEPADDVSGGVNIYTAEGGYGLSPYSAAYAYVNVKGRTTAAGAGARHVIQGYYGPDPKLAAAMRTWFGAVIDTGESSQRAADGTWTGEGGGDGATLTITVTPGPESGCVPLAGGLNYVGEAGPGDGFGLLRIPFAGTYCPATPVSVEISGPEGSRFGQLKVANPVAAWRLRDAAFAFAR